jgi:uncharacterized protein
MRFVPFGTTGLTVSEVGFGGIPIIRLDEDTAVALVRKAYDAGITLYDTANLYRDSEKKMGRALGDVRDKVILATKTVRRDGPGALEQLENSLRMLRTDYIDLYQLHQISHEEDLEKAVAPGGAMETLVKAKKQGKVRFIGVTSHNLAMAVKLVETGLFSSIQFPFNFIEDGAKDELHAFARRRGMGILAMKPFAGGMIDNAKIAFKFLREYPDVIALPGFDLLEQIDEIISFYHGPNRVPKKDLTAMDKYRRELGKQFCRRCEYCQPCPQGVMITTAMGYNVIASRMSPPIAVQFTKAPMESVLLCTDCRECMNRCPYELPIPDILKAHYDLYEKHRAESEG